MVGELGIVVSLTLSLLVSLLLCLPVVQLTSSGLHVSSSFLHHRPHWVTLLTLLVPVLLVMTLVSSAFLYALFASSRDLSYWHCFALAAASSPTDPVIASALMRGRWAQLQLSPHVRGLLSLESAVNDGAAVIFVELGIIMTKQQGGELPLNSAMGHWFSEAWAWKCVFPILFGTLFGVCCSTALQVSFGRRWCDKDALLPFSTAMTFLLLGSFELLGSNSFLAIVSAAIALSWRGVSVGAAAHVAGEGRMREVADSLDLVISAAFFAVVGACFSFQAWQQCGIGRLAAWAVCIHLTRRVPVVLLAYRVGGLPSLVSAAEALFVGWFAPIGSASVYYALILAEQWKEETESALDGSVTQSSFAFDLVLFGVLSSVVVHGLFGPAAAALLRRVQPIRLEEAKQESKEEEMDAKDATQSGTQTQTT